MIPVAAGKRNPEFKLQPFSKGYSLIELLIYVGLVSMVFSGALLFLLDITQVKEKTLNIVAENYENMALLGRSSYYSVTSNPSSFENDLNITEAMLTDFSVPNSSNYQISSEGFTTSWELPSYTPESSRLLINLIFASLVSNGDELSGIGLKNISGSTITIDRILLSWDDDPPGSEVREIQIDGDSIEWSGSSTSPADIDISDFSLDPGSNAPIDYIDFSEDMSEGFLQLSFVMSDGSIKRSEFDLLEQEGTGGTAPPPCSEWCITEGYSYGVCRSSSFWCWLYGEDHGSEGDPLCTEGSSADTCCCHD